MALYAFLLLAAAPEERGTHAFATLDAGRVDAAGTMIPLTVYYPTDLTAPAPVIAVLHGFFRNGSYMTEMAQTIASRGMIALVPDMPCGLSGCDHTANAMQVSGLLDWSIDQSANQASSPLFGLVDASKLGVIGHSWGGLAVFLSAVADPRFTSVVMLDANDDRSIAHDAAPMMTHPTMHIMASVAGNCNATMWGDTVYPFTPAPHLRVRVVGAGHCDVEDPTDGLCPITCNAGDPATTPMFRRYAIAWTECMMFGQDAEWIGGASLDADVTANTIDNVDSAMLDQLPCNAVTPPMDAGIADAGTSSTADAAVPPDAGTSTSADAAELPGDATIEPAPDATTVAGDAASPSPADAGVIGTLQTDSGCGCSGSRAPAIIGDAWVFVLALIGLRASRSRRARRSVDPARRDRVRLRAS